MEYTTRMGSGPGRAHVNYQCPCSCIGGVIYNRAKPLVKAGACCCGRLLWVGPDARAHIENVLAPDIEYEFDFGAAILPWGENVETAMAWPASAETSGHEDGEGELPGQRLKDPVCGMMIDPATAAATSFYRGQTYYFCAPACKTRFEAAPKQYVKASVMEMVKRRLSRG